MNAKHSITALTVFEAAQPYLFWLMFSVCAHMFEDADWFSDNLPLIATVWVLATGIIGALYIWLSWNSEFRSLARNAMIIKLAHIPYYLLVPVHHGGGVGVLFHRRRDTHCDERIV